MSFNGIKYKKMYNFRSPVAKRCSLPHTAPLPTFTNKSPMTAYIGVFNGLCVVISKHEDILALYTMGYFGKGSLSQGYPSYNKKLKQSTFSKFTIPDDSFKTVKVENTELKPEETFEHLYLSPEEAFFLSFSVKCLNVYYNNELLDHQTMWSLFQQFHNNFVERYVVYHYFRAKGWVVRSGIKYGGDFVLYKEGPPFFHSSYVVFIISNTYANYNRSCSSFLTYYRAIEVAKKELLICRVILPTNCEKINVNHVQLCRVSEYQFKRWIPSENRNFKPQNTCKSKQDNN